MFWCLLYIISVKCDKMVVFKGSEKMIKEPAAPMSVRVREAALGSVNELRLGGAAESFLSEEQVQEYNSRMMSAAFRRREMKLGPPEEVAKRVEEYFDLCASTYQLPSIKALALYIGVPFKVLKTCIDDPTSRYNDILTTARDMCHVVIENGAMNNKVNPATYMFTAANFYDMKNTQSVEIGRTSAEKDLAASRESIEALKSLLKKERIESVSKDAVEIPFEEKG